MPVDVTGKHGIRVEQLGVQVLKHLLGVDGAARPIYEPLGLVGRVVELVNAQVASDHPANGYVFVRVNVS